MGQKVLKGSGFQPRATEGSSFQKGVAHVGTLFGHKVLHSMVTLNELFVFSITWGNLVPTWVWNLLAYSGRVEWQKKPGGARRTENESLHRNKIPPGANFGGHAQPG